MIQIIVSNDTDIQYNLRVLLDEIFISDGAIQAFSDPERLMRYVERNIKINQAFISYDYAPTGSRDIGNMLKEKQPDISLIYLVDEADEDKVAHLKPIPGVTYIRNKISPKVLKDLFFAT